MNRRWPVLILIALSLTVACPVGALYPQGQAVTYSDYSYVRSIAASMDRVFFATTEGIIVYNQMEKTWEEPLPDIPGMDADDIEQIWVDQFGVRLYARTFSGMYLFDEALETWFPTNDQPESNPVTSPASAPTILHAPPGFNYMSGGELIDQHARRWFINDVLDDGSGMLWMGVWGYGPARARTGNLILELMPYGLLQRRVNALAMDSGYLWIGGAAVDPGRTGITGFDPDSGTFRYIETGVGPEFPPVDINVLKEEEGRLYVGTPNGVYILDGESGEVERTIGRQQGLLDENVLSLEVTGDTVYIGTSEGLSMVTGGIDSLGWVFPTTFTGQRIWDIEAVGEHLWVGASSGAFRLTPGTARLQRLTDDESVLFSDVYDIEQAGKKLWFVSDAGLVELDTETAEMESFHDITQKIHPRALAVNDSIAAVASDKGLTIFFHSDEKPFKREFTVDDGLASNTVYSLIMDGDFLWIGTDRGLTRFLWNNPERVD